MQNAYMRHLCQEKCEELDHARGRMVRAASAPSASDRLSNDNVPAKGVQG
jgi:hypothetical protein